MKRVITICGVILMTLGFLSFLFGCRAESEVVGPWSAFSVTNVSPDRLVSYHFRVSVQGDGTMTVRGYCYDEETEYRFDEDVLLSEAAAEQIRQTAIDQLMTKVKKRSLFDGQVVDDASRTAYVTDESGNEREVRMPDDMRDTLVALLRAEFMTHSAES